jgi:hypothetical protein
LARGDDFLRVDLPGLELRLANSDHTSESLHYFAIKLTKSDEEMLQKDQAAVMLRET